MGSVLHTASRTLCFARVFWPSGGTVVDAVFCPPGRTHVGGRAGCDSGSSKRGGRATEELALRPTSSTCVVAVVLLIVVVVVPPSPKSLWSPPPPWLSNWERLMMRHHLEEARSAQRRALTELIPKALTKMPKQSQEQWDCTHEPLRLRANQMFYMQTALAVEAAIARQSRPRSLRCARSRLVGESVHEHRGVRV